MSSYIPGLLGTPYRTQPYSTGPVSASIGMTALSSLTNGALDSDPRTWTPGEAAAQTDRALARIGSVNPELATSLAEAQGRGEMEDGGGFFSSLMGGIGDILHVTHLDDVFELMSRPAKILPEIIMDWGEESVWKNAGDALSGHSDVSWDDVLVDKLGMERNWFTAAVGFVGDVALDPLTYATIGLGGVARETAAMTVAKGAVGAELVKAGEVGGNALFELARPAAEALAAKSGRAVEDVMAEMVLRTGGGQAGEALIARSSGLLTRVKKVTGFMHEDAVPGVINTIGDSVATRQLMELNAIADSAFTQSYRAGFGRLGAETAEQLGIDKAGTKSFLEGMVKRGTGIMPGAEGKALYRAGKEAAAGLGGVRWHMNIPVLGVRVAPKNILPELVGQRLNFQVGRRFMAGISGEMKLERLLGKGEATVDDLRTFWEKGYEGLAATNKELARKMSGSKLPGIGSVMVPRSQGVGRLTEHLSPHAAALRNGGLGGKFAADQARLAKHAEQETLDKMMSVEGIGGSAATARYLQQSFGFGSLDTATQTALKRDLDDFSTLVPKEMGYDGVQKGFARVAQTPDTEAAMKRALELEQKFAGAGQLDAANTYRRVMHQIDQHGYDHGITPNGYESPYEWLDEMRPEDAVRAAEEGATHTRGVQYEFMEDGLGESDVFDDSILRDTAGDGLAVRGAQVRKVQEGGYTNIGSSPFQRKRAQIAVDRAKDKLSAAALGGDADAALREFDAATAELRKVTAPSKRLVVHPKNGYIRDLRTNVPNNETLTTPGYPVDIIAEVQASVEAAKGAFGRQVDEALEGADPEIVRIVRGIIEDSDTVAAATTRRLQQEGFDHVRTLTDEGEFITVFKNGDGSIPVARIEPNAMWAARGNGGTARWLTDDVIKQVNRSKALRDLPGGSKAALEQQVRRVSHLPHDEAEKALRGWLRENGVDILPTQTVLESDPFKALDAMAKNTAHRVTSKLLGFSARHLETMGLAKSVMNGAVSGTNKYRYVMNPTILDDLRSLGEDHYKAVERTAALQSDKLPELRQAAKDAAETLQARNEHMQEVLTHLDAGDMTARIDASLDEALNGRQASLDEAISRGKAEKLNDHTYRVVDASGKMSYYHTDPPAAEFDLPEGEEAFVHYVKPKGNMTADQVADLIQQKGIKAYFDKAGTPGDTRKYVFAARSRGGIVPEDRAAIVFRAPTSRIRGTGARQGSAALAFEGDITPESILSRHGAGDILGPRVRGVRTVDSEGNVSMVVSPGSKTKVEGVESALTRQHWQDEGVFDADDPFEAASEVMARGGAASPKALKQAAKATSDRLRKTQRLAQRELEGKQMEYVAGVEEVNKLTTRMTTEASQATPALVAATPESLGMAGFERLDIPGFETLAMPTFMAQEFKQAMAGFAPLGGMHAELRRFNAWWKTQATYMWPGFHVRNLYGAFFNNALGGVDIKDYIMTGRIRRAAQEMRDGETGGRWASRKLVGTGDSQLVRSLQGHGVNNFYGVPVEELTYGDLARATGGSGITASNGRAFAEARLTASEVESKGAGQRFSERTVGLKQYTDVAKGVGTLTENVMRTAAFVRGLRDYGNVADARLSTMLRHGDYSDLTEFEYSTVRDIIPFYKWMRTNLPFQVHQLLESPGKLLAVQKAQGAVFTAAGLDYDEEKYRMPKWMADSFVIPRSVNEDGTFEAVMLDLPMADLHMHAREFVSSALPLMRPFMENYIYEQSTFTGAPITGKRIPLSGVFNVPGIRDVLDVIGFAEKGEDGQLYTTDKNQNLLGVLPAFSRARDWLYSDPNRVQNRMNSFASAMFGATLRSVDADAMSSAELDFYYSQVLPAMEHLRQMGVVLPTTADIEGTLGSVDAALTNLGIAPSPTTLAA